jgi:hypothetical protein
MISHFYRHALIGLTVFLVAGNAAADNYRDFAEDVASALCGAIGASTGSNTAAAAGAVVCKYGIRVADSTVKKLIDDYFAGQDQKFVDETCSTIVYADGRKLTPSAASGCS